MLTKNNIYAAGLSLPQASHSGFGAAKKGGLVFSAPPQSIPVTIAAVLEPMLAVGTLIATLLWFDEPFDRATALLCILSTLLMFPGTNRFYERRLNAAVDVLAAWLAVVSIMVLFGVALRSFHFFKHEVLLTWVLITPMVQYAGVLAGGAFMRRHAEQPSARRRALVLGAGPLGLKVAQALRQRHDFGHDFIGYLKDSTTSACADEAQAQVLGYFDNLPDIVRKHHIKDVYITVALSSQPRMTQLVRTLHDMAVTIYFVPDVEGMNVIQGRMRTMDGMPIMSLLESPFIGINGFVKRASDIILSCILLVPIAPVMAAVAIGVKLSSPGPIIFKQRRNGLDGDEILVYKFRSMRVMENGAKVTQATRGDPRITPFGAFIRKTSLDELPQFINVLQGRMSIVGPRPHAVAHNEQYRSIIDAYQLRHKVKPGITGWAQVNGCRGETDVIEKMEARVAYDIEYLRNWSLTMDLRIIARTVKLTVFDRNAY
jgi:putative colanic acid biosynthesis UDP-glucose lipid carrier transferase